MLLRCAETHPLDPLRLLVVCATRKDHTPEQGRTSPPPYPRPLHSPPFVLHDLPLEEWADEKYQAAFLPAEGSGGAPETVGAGVQAQAHQSVELLLGR